VGACAGLGPWGAFRPTQVIYVWFDALINYTSGLGATGFEVWQQAARIEHVIGKGILRFHAVYWPAILLSAGLDPRATFSSTGI
jgi:methionyl-tRNA synthetase